MFQLKVYFNMPHTLKKITKAYKLHLHLYQRTISYAKIRGRSPLLKQKLAIKMMNMAYTSSWFPLASICRERCWSIRSRKYLGYETSFINSKIIYWSMLRELSFCYEFPSSDGNGIPEDNSPWARLEFPRGDPCGGLVEEGEVGRDFGAKPSEFPWKSNHSILHPHPIEVCPLSFLCSDVDLEEGVVEQHLLLLEPSLCFMEWSLPTLLLPCFERPL